MRNDARSTKELSQKANFLLLIGLAASLPLGEARITSIMMVIMAANWLLVWRSVTMNAFVAFFLTFYFLHLLGVAYSSNIDQALFELEKKAGFVVFPVVLSGIPKLSDKHLRFILGAFITSCLSISAICLVNAAIRFVIDSSTESFFYYPLVEIIGIHPIYLSMYICFCCFIIVDKFRPSVMKLSKTYSVFFYASLFYFVVFIFLLSARAEILAFYAITFTGILVYGYRKSRPLYAVATVLLLIMVFGIMVFSNPVNLERFKEAINYNSEYTIEKQWGGRAERLLMWDCGLDIIKDNSLFGVGPGDGQDALVNCYEARDYNALLIYDDLNYNAHNQYLETTIDLGVIGLLCLLGCLVILACRAFKSVDYLLLSFVALFTIACLTESMLEVNKGIVFFTMFSSLFAFHNKV